MQEQTQDLEKLRQLLALKRHENPPAGYFQDFSSRVLNQIQRESTRPREGWLTRLATLFQTRPAISWSFCMATCLVAVAATTLFESDPVSPAGGVPSIHAIATMNDAAVPAPAAGAFPVTNLEPRQFALEMAPPRVSDSPSNSLFSTPFYLRVDGDTDFRGHHTLPASFQSQGER